MANWRFYLKGTEVEEPIGWDSVEFTGIRQEFHGIDQPFSTALQFYGKGALLLKAEFDANFLGAEVPVLISNGSGYSYNGYVDFSSYEEINTCDTDSFSVSVTLLQDLFRDRFKSRYDVEINVMDELDLDGNNIGSGYDDFVKMLLHGQRLALIGAGGSQADSSPIAIGKPSINWANVVDRRVVLPVYWDDSDFDGIFGDTVNVTGYTWSATNVIFQDNSGGSIARDFVLAWQAFTFQVRFWDFNSVYPQDCINNGYPAAPNACNPNNWQSGVDMYVVVLNSGGGAVSTTKVFGSPAIDWDYPATGNYTSVSVPQGNITLNVPAGGRISFFLQWSDTTGNIKPYVGSGVQYNGGVGSNGSPYKFGGSVKLFDNLSVILTETNESYASENLCIPVFSLLNRIVYQITGFDGRVISNVFNEGTDGDYCNNCITTGLLLRKFLPASGQYPQVRTSFKKLMEGLGTIFNVGWGYYQSNGVYFIKVEPVEEFYQNEIRLIIENPDQLKKTPVTDKLYNQIKIGYSDNWRNMALGGTDALCVDRNYFIGNNAVKNGSTSTLEKLSDIICEGIAIEYSRRLQFYDPNAGSSDRPNDYNLFLIWTIRTDLATTLDEYKFNNSQVSTSLTKYRASWSSKLNSVAGDDLRRYNIFHTSTRVALRHWATLGMNTLGLHPPSFKFQVGEYRTRFDSTAEKPSASIIQPRVLENIDYSATPAEFLAEDANITFEIFKQEYQQYLFKPIIFEFDYPQSFCDFIELANFTGYKKVKVIMGGFSVSGWILEIKNKPEDSSGGTTSFKIIASNLPDPTPPEPLQLGAYANEFSNAYD